MPTYFQPALVGESLHGVGQFTTPVGQAAIVAGVVVVKGAPGRLCRVLVTTTTTTAQAITFYDNASAGSGTVVGIIPGASTAGTTFDIQMPCTNGITIAQNASLAAGAITVSWT